MDWAGFTDWLNADPLHRSAFDEVALVDAALQDHRDFLRAADYEVALDEDIQRSPARPKWKGWAAAAVAASLAAALALPRFLAPSPITYRAQGGAEHVTLNDGSVIMLAPHSQLVVSGDKQEAIKLTGEAWFDIRHNPARQLAIEAKGFTISDIGTRFDVQAEGSGLRVAVADGTLSIASPTLDQPIRLTQGRSLLFDSSAGTVTLRDTDRESVGLWRTGRLSYDATPLWVVVADISRYAGIKIEVAPALRDRVFSGTFVIGNGERALRDLSQLMGLEVLRNRGSYSLIEHSR
jgi:transmembrane sensor